MKGKAGSLPTSGLEPCVSQPRSERYGRLLTGKPGVRRLSGSLNSSNLPHGCPCSLRETFRRLRTPAWFHGPSARQRVVCNHARTSNHDCGHGCTSQHNPDACRIGRPSLRGAGHSRQPRVAFLVTLTLLAAASCASGLPAAAGFPGPEHGGPEDPTATTAEAPRAAPARSTLTAGGGFGAALRSASAAVGNRIAAAGASSSQAGAASPAKPSWNLTGSGSGGVDSSDAESGEAPPGVITTDDAAAGSSNSSGNLDGLLRYIGNLAYPLAKQLSYCDTLDELYDGIAVDLRHWNNSAGISREALNLASSRYTTRGNQKGVTLAFYGGVAYVIEEPKLQGLGHHVNILFTYMLVLLDLQRQYGRLIPDCEFVIASSDRPLVLVSEQEAGRVPPVMRFCSSDEHADIKIPIFHFYTKKYTQRYLEPADTIAAAYPWDRRQAVLFGRFSKYYRQIHPNATSTLRLGARNSSICRQESAHTLSCPVRAHFMEWAARRHPDEMDVKSGPRVSLEKHAAYKYLLHLDGQALSSRMEQLMPLRSLIFKEESGYKAFYYHLVRPYEHYVPVWKAGAGPEDVVEALRWAQTHDEQAQRMAAAAQAIALKYLTKRARSCYWLRLFQAYAALQRFKPSLSGRPYAVPVADYLVTVGRRHEEGKQLHRIEY